MPRRLVWPTVFWVVVTVSAFGASLLLAGYFYLPTLVTDRLPVAQIKRLGFVDFTGRVSRIGLHRTTAGPFVFGHTDQPAVAIGSITLDYTPQDLRRKKIGRIHLNDVVVNVSLGPDGVWLPGFEPSAFGKDGNGDETPVDAPSPLTEIELEKIEIRKGMILLNWCNTIYKIPFEADLRPDGRNFMNLDAGVRLFPRDQLLTLAAQVDLENRKGEVNLDGPAIDMDRFADLIHLIPGLDVTGKISVQANALLNLNPIAVTESTIELAWYSGWLTYPSVHIEPGKGKASVILAAGSENLKTWKVEARGVQLRTPAPVTLDMLEANVNLDGGMQTVAGNAELTILPFALEHLTPVALKAGVSLPVTFDVIQKASGEWTAGFRTPENGQGTSSEPLDMIIAGAGVQTGPPRFRLNVKGDGLKGAADWQLKLKTIRTTTAGTIVNLPSADAKGQFQFKDGPHGTIWSGDTRIRMTAPTLAGNGLEGKLDALTVLARLQKQGSDPPVVDARIQMSNGRIHHPASGLILSGGRLDLPYRSSPGKTGSQGAFAVAQVVHNKHVYGNIQGHVTQKKDAYTFSATHFSDLFPGMTAVFEGTARSDETRGPLMEVTFKIPSYKLPVENDLGRIVPAAKGVGFSGTVSAKGEAILSQKGVNGSLELQMAGGALQVVEKKIVVEGIDATLRFPELPRIRSGPAQQIRFVRAAMGGIVLDGGTFDIQVESEKTLFVEKGRLSWCGGKVDAGSLRITADKHDYHLSLYCQQLELSRILEQLGSVNASGTGTLNGRIPIVYSNGNIRFDDGFLFSTPGEGGEVHLTGTEIFTRGIPAGTPQFVQVELARVALEDYAYTWAKLGLVSEREDFIMRLQFDGKPVKPLPFVYKKEIGSFVRVEAGAKGSVFQGIGLDVNLRLPLNQLLQYKDIIDMIE